MKKLFNLAKVAMFAIVAILAISCSSDEDTSRLASGDNFKVEFLTGDVGEAVTVGLSTTITYQNNSQETIVSEYSYNLNKVIVYIPENAKSFSCSYFIEDSSQTDIRLYAPSGALLDQEDINQQNYTYSYTF